MTMDNGMDVEHEIEVCQRIIHQLQQEIQDYSEQVAELKDELRVQNERD